MTSQEVTYGETVTIKNNEFSNNSGYFLIWNTKSDGTGVTYTPGQSVKNLTKTPNDVIELFAIWSKKDYVLNDEFTFAGNNYINTGVYLFDESTINKDFVISFEIVSRNTATGQATLMSCMDEIGAPWPGVVYRIKDASNNQLSTNSNNSTKVETNYLNENITKVSIKRENHILYMAFNDGDYEQIIDMTQIIKSFRVPLTFGASLNAKDNPQRYFKDTLKNMEVHIID